MVGNDQVRGIGCCLRTSCTQFAICRTFDTDSDSVDDNPVKSSLVVDGCRAAVGRPACQPYAG